MQTALLGTIAQAAAVHAWSLSPTSLPEVWSNPGVIQSLSRPFCGADTGLKLFDSASPPDRALRGAVNQ